MSKMAEAIDAAGGSVDEHGLPLGEAAASVERELHGEVVHRQRGGGVEVHRVRQREDHVRPDRHLLGEPAETSAPAGVAAAASDPYAGALTATGDPRVSHAHAAAFLADGRIVDEMRREPEFRALIRGDLDLWGVDKVDGAMVSIVGQIRCTEAGRWPVQREFNRRMKLRFQQHGI